MAGDVQLSSVAQYFEVDYKIVTFVSMGMRTSSLGGG